MNGTIVHHVLGTLSVEGTPDSVFEPLGWFLDPARFEGACKVWRSRFRRSAVYSSLPVNARPSREEQAVQDCLTVYTDRNYRKAKVREEQFARAVLGACRWMERAGWVLPSIGGEPRRRDQRKWYPYNRGENARSPSPSAIVVATFNAAEDREALTGAGCDDVPGPMVAVPGGPSGRGATEGRMVRTERVVREWTERDAEGELQVLCEVITGWTMERGRGRAESLPDCKVNAGTPAPLSRFIRQTRPAVAAWQPDADQPGPVCDRTTCRPSDPAEMVWVEAGPRYYRAIH